MASHADIRRLVMNDERLSTLILTFDHSLNISNLQYALSTNVTVREIVVYTDDSFLPRFNANEIRGLFEVLGGIPSLQRLCFNARSGYEGVISVQALTYVLSRATQLSSFAVSDVKLQGTEQEWVQFAEQLENCQHLKSFCVIECELSVPPAPRGDVGAAAAVAAVRPPFGPDDTLSEGGSKSPLDPVVMVLSVLPSMDKVYLHSTRSGGLGKISGKAVGALLLSKSLKVLKIRDFELGTDTIVSMARKLRPNRTLRDVKVGTMTGFDQTAASAFATMLENNTHLECLEMGLSTMITDDCAKILSGALKANRGLKSFAITAEDNSSNGVMMKGKVSDQCNDFFVDMLRSNYVMENFVLFQRFPVKPEFKLFVTLNKLGRGKLLQSEEPEPEQWIQALATVNDDLDALYYYISINPDLCTLSLERMNRKSLLVRPNKKRKLSPEDVGSSPNHVGSLFEPSASMPASSPVGQALVQYSSHVVSVPNHCCSSPDVFVSRYSRGDLHPELVCSTPETVGSSNASFRPGAVEPAPGAIGSRNGSNLNSGSFRLAPDAVHSTSGAALNLQASAISTRWAANGLGSGRISAVPDATLTLDRHNMSSAFGASHNFRPDTSYSEHSAFGSFRPDAANSAPNAPGSFRPNPVSSATAAFGSFRPDAANSAPNAFGSFRPDTANSTPNALGSFRPDAVRSATNAFVSFRSEAVNSATSAFGSPPTGVDDYNEDDDIF